MIPASEYRDLPLASLAESANNPRRRFDEAALNELAESISESMLWPSISFEAALRVRRFLRAYSPTIIDRLTKSRLVKTSQARD
jgi:hypothetical protein